MTSEPFFKFKDEIANKFADDPELTINPYFLPKSLQIFFSNFFTFFPSISCNGCSFKTFVTALISL